MRGIIYTASLIFTVLGIINITKQIKNEKDEKLQVILTILAVMLFFPTILLVLDFMNIGNYIDLSTLVSKEAWLNFLGTYVSGISAALLSAYVVIIMTNKQIERQSVETYRPRLKMDSVEILENDEDIYLYGLFSENTKDVDPFSGNYQTVSLRVSLKNIGVGLAQDISFYNLNSGEECIRALSINSEKAQRMFSTEEIDKGEKLCFDFDFRYHLNKSKTGIEKQDYVLILCLYNDINGNQYKMLIGLIVKNEIEENDKVIPVVDSYYYQENTSSYSDMINRFIDNYYKIDKQLSDDFKTIDENTVKK